MSERTSGVAAKLPDDKDVCACSSRAPLFACAGKGAEEGTQEASPEANENGPRWLTPSDLRLYADFICLQPALLYAIVFFDTNLRCK